MATKTFLELQTALCSMWGYEDPADLLAQDLVDIKSFINGAYFDCYAPVDGSRASWPVKQHGDLIKAAVSATLTLTEGSNAVSGYAFEDKYAGSFVRVGTRYLRYAGSTTTVAPAPIVTSYFLVQPWAQPSGVYPATIFHNAVALPWNVIELCGLPSLVGIGILAALPDADAELSLRTEPAFDFQPREGRAMYTNGRRQFLQNVFFDTGEPRFYHIDQASVSPVFALGNRIHFYPVPEIQYAFDLRANVVPIGLELDTDSPQLPAMSVDNILLPIAREKLAENSAGRRYTGPNAQLLMGAASRARQQLKTLRRVQPEVVGSVRLRRGW